MGKAVILNGFGCLLLLAIGLLVTFLGQSEAARIDELNDYQTKVVKNNSKNSPRVFCDIATPCPDYFDYCSISNTCTFCDTNFYWNGYACLYCSYPDRWDYSGQYCNYNYYNDFYYYSDNSWVIWLVIGLAILFFIGTCIGVALCCIKCSSCPLYRGQKKQIAVSAVSGASVGLGPAASQQIIGYDAYGRPLVLAPNQTFYPAAPQQLAVPVATNTTPGPINAPDTVAAQPTVAAEVIPAKY